MPPLYRIWDCGVPVEAARDILCFSIVARVRWLAVGHPAGEEATAYALLTVLESGLATLHDRGATAQSNGYSVAMARTLMKGCNVKVYWQG